jgi:DNA polymerase
MAWFEMKLNLANLQKQMWSSFSTTYSFPKVFITFSLFLSMDSLKEIEEEIRSCRKCKLYLTKTNYVPGEGNQNAEIMFIGEAPGREEDLQGKPFVGSAGKLLTEMIENVLGLQRSDVFIANILKCRPPNNRDPLPEEVEVCSSYLIRQLDVMKPSTIVCLGRHSASFIFNLFGIEFLGISRVRGRVKEIEKWGKKVKVIAIYHPAAVLYRPPLMDVFEKDFKRIAELLMSKEDKESRENRENRLNRFEKKFANSTLLDFL